MFQTSFFDLRELYSKYLTLYWFAMILWQRLNFFAFILCILYKCFTKCVNISKKNLILIFVKTTNFTKYRNILRYMLQLQVISFIGFLFWERNLIKYKLCLFQNSHVIVNKPFTSFTQLSFRKVVVLLIISIYKFGLTVIRSSLNFWKFWKSTKFFVKIRELFLFCFTMNTKRTCLQLI